MFYTKQVIKLAQKFEARNEAEELATKDVNLTVCDYEEKNKQYLRASPLTYLIKRFDPGMAEKVYPGISDTFAPIQKKIEEINKFYDSLSGTRPITEAEKALLRTYRKYLESTVGSTLDTPELEEYFRRLAKMCDDKSWISTDSERNTRDSLDFAKRNLSKLIGDTWFL